MISHFKDCNCLITLIIFSSVQSTDKNALLNTLFIEHASSLQIRIWRFSLLEMFDDIETQAKAYLLKIICNILGQENIPLTWNSYLKSCNSVTSYTIPSFTFYFLIISFLFTLFTNQLNEAFHHKLGKLNLELFI